MKTVQGDLMLIFGKLSEYGINFVANLILLAKQMLLVSRNMSLLENKAALLCVTMRKRARALLAAILCITF